jgi:phosphatidylserine/phosphatidylglycerophosphate/cardiolipin synthase-like enzyme
MSIRPLLVLFTVTALHLPGVLLAQGTIAAQYFPTAVAGGGNVGTVGYPYACFVTIQGWTTAANEQVYLKLYSASGAEHMWTGSGWSSGTTYAGNIPTVQLDAGGNWSGWIYAKHDDVVGTSVKPRAARTASTGTNITGPAFTLTLLTMNSGGNGGWIVGDSSTAVNKAIAAYSGGVVVGTYRTEDNGISEGYVLGAGGFKVAVPAGIIDSLVAYHDDGSRDQAISGPWLVTAGQETNAGSAPATGGKGNVVLSPAMLHGGQTGTLRVALTGDSTVKAASFLLPGSWTWLEDTAAVRLIGSGTPTVRVAGDTIGVDGVSLAAGDSLIMAVDCAPPDTTAIFTIFTQTGSSKDSLGLISKQPAIFVYGTPLSVADAKLNDASGVPLRSNTYVTVRGVVTVANEFGSPSYIQDNSAGIAVYGSAFSQTVRRGDEVVVAGLVQPFNGLSEIVDPILISTISAGNVVGPTVTTLQQVAADGAQGIEAYECLLVRINRVSVAGSGAWAANTNYTLTDATGSVQLRVDDGTDLVGRPIPAGAFDLLGVVGQYAASAPYTGGYQIMPRATSDVIASGPIIATLPVESSITSRGFTVSWTTVNPGTSHLRFGITPVLELGGIGNDSLTDTHAVVLDGLDPATIYSVEAFSSAGTDTSFGPAMVVSTASAPPATGTINVYFNKSVNTTLAWPTPAKGNQDLAAHVVARIDSAHRSIDAALYSLSGNVGIAIRDALIRAKNRGLHVRMICEADNDGPSTATVFNQLRSVGIPVINDTFDPVNQGAGLMHNKFFIIDGREGAPDSVWVWTGSWNPTDPGTNGDYQNSIEVQDPALAGAYTREFDEMWGSDGDVPNASVSRFGARKTDNTPHRFVIGGRSVECYFSPSDHTTSHIIATLAGTQHSIAAALLTLTRSDIASTILAAKNAGRKTRLIVDNNTDQGSQADYLKNNGVDLLLKPTNITVLFHHKYGIVDAEDPHWEGTVMTGSHNWTSAAENSNNENLLIVHDPDIANQYVQEFAQRYQEFGGQDPITVGVAMSQSMAPTAFALEQNFPNPFNPTTVIGGQWTVDSRVRLEVFDVLGRKVATLADGRYPAGKYTFSFDGTRLASGVYFYRLTAGNFKATRTMLLVK